MNLSKCFVVATLIVSAPVLGHEVEEETGPESPWAGKASLGYLATSGNTDNTSLAGAFEISYTAEKWVHSFDSATFNASENNNTTAEAYAAGWKSERTFSETSFAFGRLDFRKDRFSGYDQQFSQTLGYGHRLINSDKYQLNGEVGFGARQSELADDTSESETILTGGLYFKWVLSENSEFTQDLLVEAGDKNTFTRSVTAISAKLVGDLALVASYTIRNNSKVLPGAEKTDTFTALSLEYSF